MKHAMCWIFLLLQGLSFAEAPVSRKAQELHREALVFDGHLHLITRQFYQGGDIGARLPDGQVDLPRMREGGIDAFLLTLFVLEQYYPPRYESKQTLRLLDLALQQIARNNKELELALTASDVERIHQKGKMAAVLDLEGGFDLDGDLGVLRNLHRLGLRSAQLPAHNWANNFADSCCAPPKWHGLNEQGRAVIKEMNRLGMMINVSHASDQAIEQAVEVSSDPIVATHHGLRSLNDIPRNMPDHLLKKLAAKGGVIGFHIGNAFHNRRVFEWIKQNEGKSFWDRSAIGQEEAQMSIEQIDLRLLPLFPHGARNIPEELLMSVDAWVGVVDRAIRLVGEDHVALGSDFDGGPTPPLGMRDVRDLPRITGAMLRRGYSEQRIRKFLGENWLRVFRRVTENQ